MFEKSLIGLVGLAVVVTIFVYRSTRKKINEGWMVGVRWMIFFLALCMTVGILASYLIVHIIVHYTSISERVASQELGFLGILTFFLCLVCYGVFYHSIFTKWRQIVGKSISESRIKLLERTVEKLDDEIRELEPRFSEPTKEMMEKMERWALFRTRLEQVRKDQRNLRTTRLASYSSFFISAILSSVIQILIEYVTTR